MLGRISDSKGQAAAMNPTDENYYKPQVFVGTAGESAASIHARLKSVDRSHSGYKLAGLTDTIEAVLAGDRAGADRRAAAYDSQPAGPFVLSVRTADCPDDAPFDLEFTPDFKARLAASGLAWPPPTAIKFPARAK